MDFVSSSFSSPFGLFLTVAEGAITVASSAINQDVDGQNYWKARQSYQRWGQNYWKARQSYQRRGQNYWKARQSYQRRGQNYWKAHQTYQRRGQNYWNARQSYEPRGHNSGSLARVINFTNITRKHQRRQIGGTNPLPRRISESNGTR